MSDARRFVILLVEDNPGDVVLTREALNGSPVRHALHHVPDGEGALAFLRREGGCAEAPRPDLVLLDLNLPRKSGREVLAAIKADARLKHIPVVILSSSTAAEDVTRSYELHANCYVTKPAGFGELRSIIRALEQFWFTVATLPATPA